MPSPTTGAASTSVLMRTCQRSLPSAAASATTSPSLEPATDQAAAGARCRRTAALRSRRHSWLAALQVEGDDVAVVARGIDALAVDRRQQAEPQLGLPAA